MSNSKYKQSAPGTYYHFYNRGNQKRKIFQDDNDYIFYLQRLVQACKKYEFDLICYCLVPNHIHLIARQNNSTPPSRLMSSLHTSYSMMFNKKYNSIGHLFQDRYKQKIIDNDIYMKNLVAYIHLNPVKDEMCKMPKEYRWSSYLEYVAPDNNIYRICNRKLIEEYGFKGQSFEEFISVANQISQAEAFDD